MKRILSLVLAGALTLTLAACSGQSADLVSELGLTAESKEATEHTAQVNSAVYSLLDFGDTTEYENATRGLLAAPETLELTDDEGQVIWSQKAYAFLEDYQEAPDTVNPSLWENTKNNHVYGLFEVTDGIYQVRGYDMANLTLIRGDTGWIVFDPLMSVECAQAAMALVNETLGERPVQAVIISHPHVDHFGGIEGILDREDLADSGLSIQAQLASGKVPVIVPEGFTEHAVEENVYAGQAMGRRASYQYGVLVEPGTTGRLSMGIGLGQSTGTVSFLVPTYEITETGETLTIDGVDLEFQLTPGTEAPAEMNTWLPQFQALWLAENCTGTLHNLYTLRGAEVRDGAAWAEHLTETMTRYGDRVEVAFQSHNWPHWGNETVTDYLLNTAAVYQFINDQTLAYINQGYTADEIAARIQLPEDLAQVWYTRQYYGTVAHNAKAVYQKYMGWYDGNPVDLDPLEPTESAKKWVEYLGDTDQVLRMAKEDFEAGEYQWVAEVTNVLVNADPEDQAARLLCADALEQLGYQAESGAWRNVYLSAARELREGNSADQADQLSYDGSLQKEMTAEMIFAYMGILLDKEAMADRDFTMNVVLTDTGERHSLRVKNSVLLCFRDAQADDPDVTITCPKNGLFLILKNDAESVAKAVQVEGDAALLNRFMENLTAFDTGGVPDFNMVEP